MKIYTDHWLIKLIDYGSKGGKLYQTYQFYYDDIGFSANTSGQMISVNVHCKTVQSTYMLKQDNCIECIGGCQGLARNRSVTWLHTKNIRQTENLTNAFIYLVSLLVESSEYSTYDADPFASSSSIISGSAKEEIIKLGSTGGVPTVPIIFNGTEATFIIDSGASDVNIPAEFERKLISSGALEKHHYISPALYKLANGSIISCRRFIAKSITVGNKTTTDVRVSVGTAGSPFLLGNSFFMNFNSWSINIKQNSLLIK